MEQRPQQEATQQSMARERAEFHRLLQENPNYFGQLKESKFKPVEQIQGNTGFEQLRCVGLYPERNTVEAILEIKRPYGYGGDLCHQPTHEYVRFYLDWDGDGDFDTPGEDLGFAVLEVHSIAEVQERKPATHICYAVARPFKTRPSSCEKPYIIKLRAVLAWEQIPTSPDFPMVWGNILECLVQIDPEGTIHVVSAPQVTEAATAGRSVDPHRADFLRLLAENPNYFGGAPQAAIQPVAVKEFDTSYEQLTCVGLYPEEDLLEAVFEVKLPYGFDGPLCSPGSHEFVRFFVDWDNDGDFSDPGESVGFATVRVHDIPEVKPGEPKTYLCYATSLKVRPPRSTCKTPLIVPARAVLAWQVLPPGPNGPVVWGNIVQCLVQFRPTDRPAPVLVAEIDAPVANACVDPVPVPACITGGSPVIGIQITGSADGAPFDHYTLRYSWGANPPVNDAVVYPDCSRPPGATTSTAPVLGGTLGYLDVTLLPPGQTQFTIYLDVFDAGVGHLGLTRTFELRTRAVEITAAAKVHAFVAEDPFNLGSFTKLIKATHDVSNTVPELSIGGAFSVDGSAYIVGCDRIMSQFVLAHFDAPPAAPAPTPPDATGGVPLIAPVVYADTPVHPWQSGCIGAITPNIVLNGDLVALWSTENCTFLGIDYSVPKALPVPYWDSSALNGRYVILLEVRDRLLPAGPFPGDVAGTDQVVVWIDNRSPIGAITSVGGLGPCADLHLNDYVGTTAEIRGVAWDWPIDPTAPQQQPNDNFGSYGLAFQKNGGVPVGIPGATPTTRVPNIWPGPLPPGANGTLANWDIVAALDGGPGPLPPGSPKLARGERCAYVISLDVVDTTHVGDSGTNHGTGLLTYAVNIINDIT